VKRQGDEEHKPFGNDCCAAFSIGSTTDNGPFQAMIPRLRMVEFPSIVFAGRCVAARFTIVDEVRPVEFALH
jgi:acyl dehydratase